MLSLRSITFGCGVEWILPRNHFDGVNERGYISYWKKVDDVDFGQGLVIPLTINFRSSREGDSPYLGNGWFLSLLESRIVQETENSFVLTQPDGLERRFSRENVEATTLLASDGWVAEIQGDTITARASCGWKLVYIRGKIVYMFTPRGRKLKYIYSEGIVSEINEEGTTRFRFKASKKQLTEGAIVEYNDKRLELKYSEMPVVNRTAIGNLVTDINIGLATISVSGFERETYSYFVNKLLQPTFKIRECTGEEREFSWDPATKMAASDSTSGNKWIYAVKPRQSPVACAVIERTNSKGETEFWDLDYEGGRETIRGTDGVESVESWFLSGNIAGMPRVKIRSSLRSLNSKAQFSYGADGKLLRLRSEVRNPGGSNTQLEGRFTDGGLLDSVFIDGKPLMELKYNKKGILEFVDTRSTDEK